MVESISVVIPVYNANLTLPDLIRQLEEVLPAFASQYEAILVNDGSLDASWVTICSLAKLYPWVKGINLMRNYGQHNALLCGIRSARSDIVVTMDDDLQNPPGEIGHLLARLEEGYDVVYGTPSSEQHGLWRVLASQVTKLALQSAMGVSMARRVSAFRAFKTSLREAFADYRGPFVSIDVLLTWGASRFASIPVRQDPRSAGKSNYTFIKLVSHASNMLTGFSTLPLHLATLIGFFFSLFGISVLLYVLIRYLVQGDSVPGFPFLASIIALFSGAQLFALGILGEYLARIHFRSMDKPAYSIREQTIA
jgi:glycosyltransferase involved in cell wall biosynthesis